MSEARTETIVTVCTPETVTFIHKAGPAGDRANWNEMGRFEITVNDVADRLQDGDGFNSAKAYGIRALLLDRTSDFRKHGCAAVLEAIGEHYEATLAQGLFKAVRVSAGGGRKAGIDPLLVQALAQRKGLDVATALQVLQKVDADTRKDIAKKLEADISALRLAVLEAKADSVDLSDL